MPECRWSIKHHPSSPNFCIPLNDRVHIEGIAGGHHSTYCGVSLYAQFLQPCYDWIYMRDHDNYQAHGLKLSQRRFHTASSSATELTTQEGNTMGIPKRCDPERWFATGHPTANHRASDEQISSTWLRPLRNPTNYDSAFASLDMPEYTLKRLREAVD